MRLLQRREFLRNSLQLAGGAIALGAFSRSGWAGLSESLAEAVQPLSASISVDCSRVLHQIQPLIYGSFTEHIGRCIYGGVYDEGSPLSDQNGFRKDVMAAVRQWGVPIIRWPGGNFASGYHWMDGIGPKASRPRKYNAAWFEEESNHFGTDEFVTYCHDVGAEPYIAVNLGTGTPEEAGNWVEYCNATTDTYYANLRRKNGFEKPHNVRYWALGNEVYGPWQIGHKNAKDYAKIALEAAKLMKWVDPTIKVVACGSEDPEWDRVVLQHLTPIADYISLHDYEGTNDYYELLGTVRKFEQRIRRTEAAIEMTDGIRTSAGQNPDMAIFALSLPELKNKKRIEVAVDEWNIWYRKWNIWRRDIPNPVEEIFNLRDALWVATVLNMFQRMGNVVTMANLAQMVNAIAPIFTTKNGMFLQTIFYPLALYRHECGSQFLESRLQSPTFFSKSYKDVPYLDVSATRDDAGNFLSLAVINRHETAPVKTEVAVAGWKMPASAAVFEINGSSPDATNSLQSPNNVTTKRESFDHAGEKFEYMFPAHSITLLKFGKERALSPA